MGWNRVRPFAAGGELWTPEPCLSVRFLCLEYPPVDLGLGHVAVRAFNVEREHYRFPNNQANECYRLISSRLEIGAVLQPQMAILQRTANDD